MKRFFYALVVVATLGLSAGEFLDPKNECDPCEIACPPCDPCEMLCGGWLIGFNHSSFGAWNLMAGYYGEHLLVDLGYGFDHIKFHRTGDSFDLHELNGHLGIRSRVCCENLFFTFGLHGTYVFRSNSPPETEDPYEIGAFLGLDYQLSRHFLLSGKVSPYAFERLLDENEIHRVFTSGSITFAYVF